MKAAVDHKALHAALRQMSGLTRIGSTIPVLGGVVLRVLGDRLTVSATDMEEWRSVTVAVDQAEDGEALVDHARLTAAAGLAAGDTHIALTDKHLIATAGRAKWQIGRLSLDDWPAPQDEAPTWAWTMPTADLVSLLKHCEPAMGNEATRYYLNGVHIAAQTDRGEALLRFESTDGHRLARARMPLPASIPTPTVDAPSLDMIVPRRFIQFLCGLSGETIDLSVAAGGSGPPLTLTATCGNVNARSRLIDGTYPDASRVVPMPAPERRITVDAPTLLAATRRVRIAADPGNEGRAFPLRIDLNSGLSLSARHTDSDSCGEEGVAASVPDLSGLRTHLGVNSGYFADALAWVDGEAVLTPSEHQSSPAPLRIEDPTKPDREFFLMEYRV